MSVEVDAGTLRPDSYGLQCLLIPPDQIRGEDARDANVQVALVASFQNKKGGQNDNA